MEVYAFMALMRMTLAEDKVVANLAQIALNLAKGIRDAEVRAELAEASLEAERARITSFMSAIRQYGTPDGRAFEERRITAWMAAKGSADLEAEHVG